MMRRNDRDAHFAQPLVWKTLAKPLLDLPREQECLLLSRLLINSPVLGFD